MAKHGNAWQRMATHGNAWQRMATHGNACIARFGAARKLTTKCHLRLKTRLKKLGSVGILIMVQQVRVMMVLLNMVDYVLPGTVNLNFFYGQVGGTILSKFGWVCG